MIKSEKYNYIYVAITKTASTSIQKALRACTADDTLTVWNDSQGTHAKHIKSNGLRHIFKNYDKYKVRGKKQMIVNRENFSFEAMKEKLINITDTMLEGIPQQVELKLPTLKKEPKKLKLPKLKKG